MTCYLSSFAILVIIAASLLPIIPASADCDGIVASVGGTRCLKPGAGKTDWFKDSPNGPEMVVVPAGQFTMGSPDEEPGHIDKDEDELVVTIEKPFAVGRFAVTRGEFAAFMDATAYKIEKGCFLKEEQPDRSWRSPGFVQNDRHPVVCINWNDAKAYVKWLSSTTGKAYRLLSDAEREYITRSGTKTMFWWGDTLSTRQAQYNAKGTAPVDSFAPNSWGLYNVIGNVSEWTEDCWRGNNLSNPADGSPRLRGGRVDCTERVIRGGVWNDDDAKFMRAAYRTSLSLEARIYLVGFRVARTL
jgi:formylglycine-generating enzyme required for sulfatase activity